MGPEREYKGSFQIGASDVKSQSKEFEGFLVLPSLRVSPSLGSETELLRGQSHEGLWSLIESWDCVVYGNSLTVLEKSDRSSMEY